LRARSTTPDVAFHRRIWRFITRNLDGVDFRGRSVLEIGCWDGYWSFYAERRGAAAVLATDDATQNWAGSAGLLLAKELLGSAVEARSDVSIYELDGLGRRFDIILCLGVYYHLVDPFYAFAQIRHRCNPDAIVVFEGDITGGIRSSTMQLDLSDHRFGIFVPTKQTLGQLLEAAYFKVVAQDVLRRPTLGGRPDQLRYAIKAAFGRRGHHPPRMNRAVTVCRPFEGVNPLHAYRPPFGLSAYDDRFRPAAG